jgi:hypothetical protein
MRKLLRAINKTRAQFSGVYVRCGTKRGWRGRIEFTLLFKDITDDKGIVVCDHLWFNDTKGFSDMAKIQGGMEEGDVISFHARVKRYTKGYCGCSSDYKLSHPTRIHKLKIAKESEKTKN